ncbi:hypothetical protein V1499_22995 (plasmid) [Neobacillus sp. SCS-31]|uniref:hypothetical protein n=1 Tax=Neobacillus oceani TaxID=3115292 RepID=UPI00390631A2
MDTYEKAYSPKEVSLTLAVGDSTLRKWCIALEKNEYQFMRNEQNNRVFVEGDLVVLKHFQNLVKQHNMQLDNAASLVVDRFGKGSFSVGTGIVPAENEEERRDLDRSNPIVKELLNHIKAQEEYNQELLKRLEQQQRYIEERLEKRDQMLMEVLNESRETKMLLIEANERKKARKGIMRWFGKDSD